MNQKSLFILFLFVLETASAPAYSTETLIEPETWVGGVEGTGPSVKVVGKKAVVNLPAYSTDGAGAVFGAGYNSACRLEGNFDMQFDYALNDAPMNNGVRLGMGIAGSIVERTSFSTHDS